MDGLNGLDATVRAVREHRDVRVIVLSMHKSEEYVVQALRAGASGYLLKDAATSELETAIRTVMQRRNPSKPRGLAPGRGVRGARGGSSRLATSAALNPSNT